MSATAPAVAASGGGTFRSLRVRNFRLFFGGQLVSQTGTWLTMIAQTLLVLQLSNGSGIALGVTTACQYGPVLLLGVWTGAVADRIDKRRWLIGLQTLAMIQSFGLAAMVFAGAASIRLIYALAAVQGVITAFDNPIRRAFVVELVPTEEVANAVSLNTSIMTGSRVFGPALAGLLVVTVGYGWCFAIDAVSYLGVIWGLWEMRPAEMFSGPPARRAPRQVRDGLAYTYSRPELFIPLVMMALVGTFAFNFSVTVPLFVTDSLHRSKTTFTILFSVLSVGSVLGALYTARRTTVTARNLTVSALGFGLTMAALGVAPGLVMVFLSAVVLGFASSVFLTSSTAIVQLRADPAFRGRVLALQGMVFLGSTPIGGPAVGWVCEMFGARAGILLGALACFAAAAYAVARFGRKAIIGGNDPMPRPVDPTPAGAAAGN